MSEVATPPAESMEYRTEVQQLLHILAHSLYTDREIFLRELISNASDALNRVQFEMLTNHEVVDPDLELAIWLEVDPEQKSITISDSGIGMNRAELVENLGTIAHSGAKKFVQTATEKPLSAAEIIGQFGVGFYSVFMVAEEISVTTRSFRSEDQAWTWRSQGQSSYELLPAERTQRGTTILIKLKQDAAEFASSWRLEQIVKKHSDYVSFAIYLVEAAEETDAAQEEQEATGRSPRMLNRRKALWRHSPREVEAAQYIEFYKQLTLDQEEPLLHVHLVADAPVNIHSILYVPARRERGLFATQQERGIRLYSRKVLIQERNSDLLPDYLRFVEGVVDSEDLPLNVSRETVQSNPLIRQIRRALTGRLHKELKTLADEKPEEYARFWRELGVFLKEGVATDPSSHEALIDLLRFHTTRSTGPDEIFSLKEVVARMAPEQKAIYYVLGEDLKSVTHSPHLDYFRAHEIEVLTLVDPVDGFMTSMLREYEGKPLQNIDDAGLELPEQESLAEAEQPQPQGDFDQLGARFKDVLGDRVTDVRESKQLVNNPCRLVFPEHSIDRDLQRLRRMMEQDYAPPKKILEFNRRHPLIRNIAQMLEVNPGEPLIDASIAQLFDNALLLEGMHPNPADMAARVQLLMEAAVAARVTPPAPDVEG